MKIVKVDTCDNCPYLRWDCLPDVCGKNNKEIKDIDTIPRWCPLEDYKK